MNNAQPNFHVQKERKTGAQTRVALVTFNKLYDGSRSGFIYLFIKHLLKLWDLKAKQMT